MNLTKRDHDHRVNKIEPTRYEWGEEAPAPRGIRTTDMGRTASRDAWGATETAPGIAAAFSRVPAWAIVATIGTMIIVPSIGRWCALAPDSIAYLSTARTLYETGGLPNEFMMRPPGFPVALAPLFLTGDLPLLAIRILLGICFVAAGALTTVLFNRELGRRAAIAAGLLVVTNCALIHQSGVALSELLFIPLQLAALIILDRARGGPRLTKSLSIMAGLVVSAAVLTRSLGVFLIPIGAAMILFSRTQTRRDRVVAAALFGIAAVVMPAAWQLRQSSYPIAQGYGRMWTQAMEAEQSDATGLSLQFERLEKFGPLRLDGIKAAMIPNTLGWRAFQSSWASAASWLVGGAFIAIALARVLIKRSGPDAYVLATLGALALWPWDEGVRLIVPLIPFFAGGLVWAIVGLYRKAPRPIAALSTAAVAGLLLIAHSVELGLTFERLPRTEQKAQTELGEMQEFAKTLDRIVPPDASILCITPNGHNAKLTVAGGAFIAKRDHVGYLDVIRHLPERPIHQPGDFVVIESSIGSLGIAEKWGISPIFWSKDLSIYGPKSIASR